MYTSIRRLRLRQQHLLNISNRFRRIMVREFASRELYRGFKLRWGQTKDYIFSISCIQLRMQPYGQEKERYCLARNQRIVSEWSHMNTFWLLFQSVSTIKESNSAYWSSIKRTSSFSDNKCQLFLSQYSSTNAYLELSYNKSLNIHVWCFISKASIKVTFQTSTPMFSSSPVSYLSV